MNGDWRFAPGWPGIEPRWTSSAKTGVGTSFSAASRVWFTIGHGILNEIYFPGVDRACTRDVGLIVTSGRDFVSEEKRHARSDVSCPAAGVPAYHLTNHCLQGRYRMEKQIIADPWSHAVLQRTRFVPLAGTLADYRLFVLAAPHLGNRGAGNTAWVGAQKGQPMLFASRDVYALAAATSAPWRARSVGFAGPHDAWHDLMEHGFLSQEYTRAENGNVELCGEVDLAACGGEFVLAIGFGTSPSEAGYHAIAGVRADFDAAHRAYVEHWAAWQESLLELKAPATGGRDLYRTSTAVLSAHEGDDFPGGAIASLSIPWGFAKGDEDLGGYHLVWPRDLVETAGGLLAAGALHDARRILRYLRATQEADGHWPQNMWLDGTSYWNGIQLDEAAFPVLLVDLALREGALDHTELAAYWPMVRRAVGFLVRGGPVTQQDRWEEDPGYSPFTLAVEISALLAGADVADVAGETRIARHLRETADQWNASIERWLYVTDTDLARQVGVDGYYVRIAPEDTEAASIAEARVPIKNRPAGMDSEVVSHLVSPDALALVRFGLRAANDPRIVNTVRVIDALLKVELPAGPSWYRYNGDGYGERADGAPFDGTGIGRPWPLLTGERAHYELAAGRAGEAERLLGALAGFANEGGMIPEQVWDAADVPEHELVRGKPTGSAMPLVWAHSEYIKLLRSLRDGRVFDMPRQTVARYVKANTGSPLCTWRFNQRLRSMRAGLVLRVETLAPATVRWTHDAWRTHADLPTEDTGLGAHLVDLPTGALAAGDGVEFTFQWRGSGAWEGTNFTVRVA